jgi:hypothetical protein
MAKFCNKCGSPVSGATFCNKCGADLRTAANPAPQPVLVPSPQAPPPTPVAAAPAPQQATSAKGSPVVKILVAFGVVVIALMAMAAGGAYYVVHRVKEKVHEIANDLPSINPSSSSSGSSSGSGSSESSGGSSRNSESSTSPYKGDACRLLSKAEVGSAIGVEIVATETTDGGCSYLAKGNSGDMTAKHLSAMAASKGADSQQQKMIEGIAGGLFKGMQTEQHPMVTSDSNGNVPVFAFGIDGNAETQIRLNAKVLGALGSEQGVPGIGDQAFDEAGAMMMVRKGDNLIRIMYSTCPCNLEAIKPLAGKLADRL